MSRMKHRLSFIILSVAAIALLASCATMFTKGGSEYRGGQERLQ